MSTKFLNRDKSPFPEDLWERLDRAAADAARTVLTARRFLDVDGPYGLGLTALEVGDETVQPADREDAVAVVGRAIPMPQLAKSFRLSVRRVVSALEGRQPLDLGPAAEAAEAVARREEHLIYHGQPDLHLFGLLTAPGTLRVQGGDWTDPEAPVESSIRAITELDRRGFRGPYALVAAPELYNGLFRHYSGTELTQLRHLSHIFERGIYKAPIEGAVAIDPRAAIIVVGLDLHTGFRGSDGVYFDLYLTESVALKLEEPQAVCAIAATATAGRGGSSVRTQRKSRP